MRSTLRLSEVLRRATPVLPAAFVVGVVLGALASGAQTPSYAASGEVQLITASQLGQPDSTTDDSRSLATVRAFVLSDTVINATAQALKLDPLAVRGALTVTTAADADILSITAKWGDAHTAGEIARQSVDTTVAQASKAATDSLNRQVQGLADQSLSLRRQAADSATTDAQKASDLATATSLDGSRADLLARIQAVATPLVVLLEPTDPVSSESIGRLPLALGGGLVALVIASGIALLRAGDPDTVTTADVQPGAALEGATVISRIGSRRRWPFPPRLPDFEHLSGADASVTIILATRTSPALRSLLVTSVDRATGRSTLTAALAVTASRLGLRTLVVDADLRSVGAERFLADGKSHGPGLQSVLKASSEEGRDLREVLAEATVHDDLYNVHLMAAGPDWWESVDLVHRLGMRPVVRALSVSQDLIVVDSAALPVPETLQLATAVDGVILLVAEGLTSRRRLRQTMTQLEANGSKILGLVGVPAPPRRQRRNYTPVPRDIVVRERP